MDVTPWYGGATVNATVTNKTSKALSSWQVSLPWAAGVSSVWSGVNHSSGSNVVVSNESWNGQLAAGGSTTFGMTITYPSPTNPTGCTATTSNGSGSCTVNSGTVTAPPTPTPTDSGTPTPTPTTPTPTPTIVPPAPLPADFKLAPYVDMGGWPVPDLTAYRNATGISTFSLAFITSAGGCTPAWGGYPTLAINNTSDSQLQAIDASIANLRAGGGDALISFGGANGTEIAQSCTSVSSLQAAYQAVIDKYKLTRIDFDIEGGAQGDHAANIRRSQAIAAIQANMAAAGKQLTVTYTLPVLQTGLTADGLGVLHDAVTGGMRTDLVNVMAMDYGGAVPQMGQAAIDAGNNTANQISFLYPSLTTAQRLSRVGITAMIGENDIANEQFTIQNAAQVRDWIRANGVGLLAWWEVGRDRSCDGGIPTYACSGTSNAQWAYAKEFTKA